MLFLQNRPTPTKKPSFLPHLQVTTKYFRLSNPVSKPPCVQDYFIHDEESEGVHPNFVGYICKNGMLPPEFA